jgi:FlaA1/EpsC-like NDP-sugar epimerase
LGKTKWIGELITSYYRRNGNTNYTSVRFGNVFNSRGSVIETFIRQLVNNQPVTLTDINVSRYFMKLDEAATLSIASVIMNVDEVHILNMGEPVKLIDVIQRLKNELNSSSPINIVGLRKGEKLNEELIAEYETISENSTNNIKSLTSKRKFTYLPEFNHNVSSEIEAVDEITKLISFTCIN